MCTGVGRQGRRADEDEAMATAAPPGCDQQHDRSRGKKEDSHPAAKQHQCEGLLNLFQQLHDDDDDERVVVVTV